MTRMTQRNPKRARKKAAAAARRAAQVEAAKRRRQRRIVLTVATVLVLLGGGVAAFLLGREGPDEAPLAGETPTPAADADADENDDAAAGPDADGQPVACGAESPAAADAEKPSFDTPGDGGLEPDRSYLLRLETSCGTIDVELDHAASPTTTNSVAFLAREGFYDGLTFHRIVPGFVVQGGDPAGDGTGGPGYQVEEAPPEDLAYTPGVVAMAKAGPDPPGTSGSQFFIVSGEDGEALGPEFALVGRVGAGMDVVEQIEATGDGEGPPSEITYIEGAEIVEQ